MYLVKLVYASQVAAGFVPGDLDKILESARRNNARRDITGLLCFNGDYFLQCLEGGRSEVNELFAKICADQRHRQTVLLNYGSIDHREFSDWSMGCVPNTAFTRVLLLKYGAVAEFNPFQMSGESATALLSALGEYVGRKSSDD